jgi:hypothetical protein
LSQAKWMECNFGIGCVTMADWPLIQDQIWRIKSVFERPTRIAQRRRESWRYRVVSAAKKSGNHPGSETSRCAKRNSKNILDPNPRLHKRRRTRLNPYFFPYSFPSSGLRQTKRYIGVKIPIFPPMAAPLVQYHMVSIRVDTSLGALPRRIIRR